jgi:hypothetical protein
MEGLIKIQIGFEHRIPHSICPTLWIFNIAMENGPFIDDFPINTSIYRGFSMAMLNNRRVFKMMFWGVHDCHHDTANPLGFAGHSQLQFFLPWGQRGSRSDPWGIHHRV